MKRGRTFMVGNQRIKKRDEGNFLWNVRENFQPWKEMEEDDIVFGLIYLF